MCLIKCIYSYRKGITFSQIKNITLFLFSCLKLKGVSYSSDFPAKLRIKATQIKENIQFHNFLIAVRLF